MHFVGRHGAQYISQYHCSKVSGKRLKDLFEITLFLCVCKTKGIVILNASHLSFDLFGTCNAPAVIAAQCILGDILS